MIVELGIFYLIELDSDDWDKAWKPYICVHIDQIGYFLRKIGT